jgi:hypothetical protein
LKTKKLRGLQPISVFTSKNYLKRGFQTVPINPKNNKPYVKFKNIDITEEFIDKHARYYEIGETALLTRGVWGIDIDTHKADPAIAKQIYAMVKMFGLDLLEVMQDESGELDGYSTLLNSEYRDEIIRNGKNSFAELTASGGLHFLFKKRDDMSLDYGQHNGAMEGIDVKAHHNNYIKIFPSVGRDVLHAVPELAYYEGKLEKKLFADKQHKKIITHYVPNVKNYGPSRFIVKSLGQEAYERVAGGESWNRNDDLFKGAAWAIERGKDIDALRVIIGTVKGNDVFTEEEFMNTINSAMETTGGQKYFE